jgi:hypothetical protein
MLGFNGGLIGKARSAFTAGAVGVWTLNEQVRYKDASNWPFFADGTPESPFGTPAQATGRSSGVYYYKPAGYTGAPFEAYTDCDTTGGPWALTWIVTNVNGDGVDWWNGDSFLSGATGTNHFTSISTLGSTLSETSKTNAKNPLFDYLAFTKMMIKENHSGTLGTKRYALSASATFRSRFDGTPSTAANSVSSVLGSSGSFSTFTTNDLYFNYSNASNDGGRLLAALPLGEASGGIGTWVDKSRSYGWKGNLTRSDANRHYNTDGTTTDHTVWIFVA